MVAVNVRGGVDRDETAHKGVNYKAGVGAVSGDMRGELAVEGAVHLPADVTEHTSGAGFLATFVANGAGIHHGKVEGMGGVKAKGGVRVRRTTDGSTGSGGTGGGEEVDKGGGSGGYAGRV